MPAPNLAAGASAFRWVCSGCGKFTEVNGDVHSLHDSTCVHWAIKCQSEKVGGKWVALDDQTGKFKPVLRDSHD